MSKIEWTNKTWNPIVGCSKISEGCENCYAEKMAARLASMAISNNTKNGINKYVKVIQGRKWDGTTFYNEEELNKPLKWKKSRMIFVCSMGDLFHESIPFEWIDRIIRVIQMCSQHTFQLLTKRPKRMKEYFDYLYNEALLGPIEEPLQNLWLGVTAENQEQANKRIPVLLEIPAAKKFVSCEPLLGVIDLHPWLEEYILPSESMYHEVLNGLDWVIAGPETGPKSRPMKKEWIENIYYQCKSSNTPFFDKKDSLGLNLKQFPNE